jgi:hypothetical protein
MQENMIMGDFLGSDAEETSHADRVEQWLRNLAMTPFLLGALGGLAQVKGWI